MRSLHLRVILALTTTLAAGAATLVACSSSSDKGAADGGARDSSASEDAADEESPDGPGGGNDGPTGPYPDAGYTAPDGCTLAGGACQQGTTCCSAICGDAGVCTRPTVQQ